MPFFLGLAIIVPPKLASIYCLMIAYHNPLLNSTIQNRTCIFPKKKIEQMFVKSLDKSKHMFYYMLAAVPKALTSPAGKESGGDACYWPGKNKPVGAH